MLKKKVKMSRAQYLVT